jgi:hypothetical protein
VSDEITLRIPGEKDFHRVAYFVVGGLAVRLDLTFEHLEDLNLALDGLLGWCAEDTDLTVTVKVDDDDLETTLGPFPDQRLTRYLSREREGVGLRRLLETVTDGFTVSQHNGGEWVALHKRVRRTTDD